MVMEPGGYRFRDYWKLGLPLLVLFGVVAVGARPGLLAVLIDGGPMDVERDRRSVAPYVSTGHLPAPSSCSELDRRGARALPDERRRRDVARLPGARRASPGGFGVCVAGIGGASTRPATRTPPFTIMSVAEALRVRARLPGARARGAARADRRERHRAARSTRSPRSSSSGDGRTNPMVNPGAIAATSLVPGTPRRSAGRLHPARPLALRRPRRSS